MLLDIKNESFKEKLSLIEKYFISQKPYTTADVEEKVAGILISYKAGKKVASISKYKAKGKNAVSGVIVPRGALSKEFVYGKIKTLSHDIKNNELIKYSVKYLFENPNLIFKEKIKKLVVERLNQYENDSKKALNSLKNEQIQTEM